MTTLTIGEISDIERAIGHELPGLYRRLLVEEGYGQFGPDAEIYHPGEVWDLYAPFFDDPEQLFNPYFPFGCQNRKQELWIIDALAERAASIWHETVPEDWPEEEWLTYDRWVQEHLEPERPSTA